MNPHVPILCYHSIAREASPWIAPFTITPQVFAEHLDAIHAAGASTMTVSKFVEAVAARRPLAPRTVLLTFDDGFADFAEVALPAMTARGIASTLYATTAFLQAGRGPCGDRMLSFHALADLAAAGVEIGAHSHTHPELDVLRRGRAREEIVGPKAMLEDALGDPVRSFAYPHGYSSRSVRRLVREAGYASACAVMNRCSSPAADPHRIARLLIGHTTSADAVSGWIAGEPAGGPAWPAPLARGAWRAYRRAAVRMGMRPAVNL